MNVDWNAVIYTAILRIIEEYDLLLLYWPNWEWTSRGEKNFTFHSRLCIDASHSHYFYVAYQTMGGKALYLIRRERCIAQNQLGEKSTDFQWICFVYFRIGRTSYHRMQTMMENELNCTETHQFSTEERKRICYHSISVDECEYYSSATNKSIRSHQTRQQNVKMKP